MSCRGARRVGAADMFVCVFVFVCMCELFNSVDPWFLTTQTLSASRGR